MKAIVFFISFPIFVILRVVFLCWICFPRPDFLPRFFQIRKDKLTPSMLNSATNGFSKKNLVAKSRGLEIYRGFLRDGSEVRIETYWNNNNNNNNNNNISREERKFC